MATSSEGGAGVAERQRGDVSSEVQVASQVHSTAQDSGATTAAQSAPPHATTRSTVPVALWPSFQVPAADQAACHSRSAPSLRRTDWSQLPRPQEKWSPSIVQAPPGKKLTASAPSSGV